MVTPPLPPTRRSHLHSRRTLAALLLCALCAASWAAERLHGLPFSRTYSLDDIGYVPRGSRLNFDRFGRIAVIHDGVYAVLNDTSWINQASPDESSRLPMTDVVHAADGQSYYVGRASWGRAEFGSDGALHAKPLGPAEAPAWTRSTLFEDVIVTTDGVYFSGGNGFAFWNFATQRDELYEVPGLSRSFAIGSRVFVSSPGHPLRYFDVPAHALHDNPTATPLDHVLIDRVAALDDGRVLLSLFDGQMFVFDGREATPWAGLSEVHPKGRISALCRLADGNIALGASGQGVFVLSPSGALVTSFTTPQFMRVSSIASRENGVLWVLTEDSIEKILYRGGLSSFSQRQGVTLFFPSVARCGERTFVASARTLFEAIAGGRGESARFERVEPQPPGGTISLTAAGGHLLVGNGEEVYAFTAAGGWERICRLHGLSQLAFLNEKQCYAIGSSEIALLEWDGQRWIEPVPRVAGLAHTFDVHPTRHGVWVEMSGDGVARIHRKGDRLETMVLRNEGWTKALWVNIGVVGDTVVLSPIGEPRRFFDEATESWCQRPQLAQLLDSSKRWLSRVWQDDTGTLWAAHRDGLVRFTPAGDGYRVDRSSFDLINDRYPEVRILPGNDIWVTASRSLHHVEEVTAPLAEAQTAPLLVSLKDTRSDIELLASRPQPRSLRLSHRQNSLTFSVFSGGYAWRRPPAYEFRLNPGDPWTMVGAGYLFPLPSLGDGQYTLQVRAAGGGLAPSPAATLAFEILPPWHRTWPAYIAYAALFVLGVFGLTRWSSHLARRRNRVLESVVRDRTQELEATMRKLNEETRISATLAERDRLAGEIHDSVQQGLSGAIMQLDTTLKTASVPNQLHSRLATVRNMISYARQEVQHTVWGMTSPLLEGNDLGEALRKITTFTASSTLIPTVAVTGVPRELPRRITHHLLRVAQEATTNALRHAGAQRVDIRLEYRGDSVALTVEDDGVGFDPQAALNSEGHFGLTGMRGRARTIDGELTVRSGHDAGTTIQIVVPFSTEA